MGPVGRGEEARRSVGGASREGGGGEEVSGWGQLGGGRR